jgi:hypothetical protein
MKILMTLGATLAGCLAAVSAQANPPNPPAQLGNSFIAVATYWPTGGILGTTFLYLAPDGTCKILSSAAGVGPIPPTTFAFSSSSSGTYAYAPVPGSPNEATLTLAVSGLVGSPVQTLYFGYGFDLTSGFSLFLPAPNPTLTNVSNFVTLRAGDTPTTGFVIVGTSPRIVLIRAVGPSLASFGVSAVSNNPKLELYSGSGLALAAGQNWSLVSYPQMGSLPPISNTFQPAQFDAQAMNWIFSFAGAFPLMANSNDQVFFGMLNPGAYTVQVSDPTVGANGGAALVEVYILPCST